MSTRSLRRQFFINSSLVVIIVMIISAILIDISYRHQIEKSEQEKLKLHIFNLLSVSKFKDGETALPIILSNPSFNTPGSDIWALVLDNKKQVIWGSLSLTTLPKKLPTAPKKGNWHHGELDLNKKQFFTTSYTVQWEEATNNHSNNLKKPLFQYIVGQQIDSYHAIVKAFRFWLILGFVAFTLTLLSIQFFVLKLSFYPIKQLGEEIKRLENGQQNKLKAQYPKELVSITKNLNMLIDKEHQQREKYRAGMADLAHSLKTPISIISAELNQHPDNPVLTEALLRINHTIEYQLRRAVISGHNLLTKGTDISTTLNMVLLALNKIYKDSNITVIHNIAEECLFFGDENDLLEIFGNLIDNAFKHAKSNICINAFTDNKQLFIQVEDDGFGVPKDKVNFIFSRGTRLDETIHGQGIGLAIVEDIVCSYGGEINLKRSRLGGALFIISFKFPKMGTTMS